MINRARNVIAAVFGADAPIERRIFHAICVITAAASFALFIMGLLSEASVYVALFSVLPLVNGAVAIFMLMRSVRAPEWKNEARLVIFMTGFIFFPYLWIVSGGVTGFSSFLIFIYGVAFTAILGGKSLYFALAVDVLYSALIIMEIVFPEYFRRDGGLMMTDESLLLGFSLSFIACVFLIRAILNVYQRLNVSNTALLNKYNEQNESLEAKNAELEKSHEDMKNLLEELEYASKTDPLTGIYNRRFLSGAVNESMTAFSLQNTPFCLALIDIDFFKKINDTYGHNHGDDVLILLSKAIYSSLEDKDIFGRYGGEEFLVIFNGQDMGAALKKCGRIYKTISATDWGIPQKVTISSGLIEYESGVDYAELLRSTDKNLYAAKENGRNQMVFGPDAQSVKNW